MTPEHVVSVVLPFLKTHNMEVSVEQVLRCVAMCAYRFVACKRHALLRDASEHGKRRGDGMARVQYLVILQGAAAAEHKVACCTCEVDTCTQRRG